MDFTQQTPIELAHAVARLHAEYAHAIDDDRLEEWPEFFVDTCLYRVVTRENEARGLPTAAILCDSRRMLIDRVVSLRNANIYAPHHYRHIVGSLLITAVTPHEIAARSHYAVFRTRGDGASELFSAGRYDDCIVSADGRLKFRVRQVIADTHRVDSLLVVPL